MYVCLYLYVYLFYCVYCVPCTANRKPVCHFTCGLLTFTEARRDGTSDNSAPPAPGLQARRRIPWGRAMPVPPPLPRGIPAAQRLPVRAGTAACTYRAPSAHADPAAESEGVCHAAVCRIRPLQPEIVPGMYARRTTCKHVANNRRRSHPSNNTRKPCRSWENARPQGLQKMRSDTPKTPIDQLCGLD